MAYYRITRHTDEIYQITLNPPIEGFDDFITAWLYTCDKTFLIDTGPKATACRLVDAIRELSIRPDYIVLTHIHIDHAGGVGKVSDAFPNAPVICHEKALKHLADPSRLWDGSLKTLGRIAEAYGKPSAVPQERLAGTATLDSSPLVPIITPGHAPHHVSYMTPDKTLFAGEAGGVTLEFGNGATYMRPATPPPFRLTVAVESIEDLICKNPRKICYSHVGMRDNPRFLLEQHKRQLYLWQSIIEEEMAKSTTGETLALRCVKRILREDRSLAGLELAGEEVKKRELFFLENSVKGYIESEGRK